MTHKICINVYFIYFLCLFRHIQRIFLSLSSDEPDKPDTPDEPDKPDKPGKPSGTGQLLPKTGDLSNPLLWTGIGGATLLVLILLISCRKKEEDGDEAEK